jgi:heme-degrading monooxygenase HmoA
VKSGYPRHAIYRVSGTLEAHVYLVLVYWEEEEGDSVDSFFELRPDVGHHELHTDTGAGD